MKANVLLEKVKAFRELLVRYRYLWDRSIDANMSDDPIRNCDELRKRQADLYKLFYPIDDYLNLYSKGRLMYHPATGIKWDIYMSAIGNDIPQRKGVSLDNAILELEGIIAILSEKDPAEDITIGVISSQEKRIFISHGRETKALDKICRYLRGLGLYPAVVKNEPSLGKALDDLVEAQMDSCVCVIVLATADDRIKSEKEQEFWQPRPNVIHEIGLAQEKLKNKIIYLKEETCNFPSNISPKVWENFSQDNMETAYLKIAKELKAFGIIQ